MRAIVVLCFGLLLARSVGSQGFVPEPGFVPDSKTAVKIAEAVLEPIYGEKTIDSERPFTAKLKNGDGRCQGRFIVKMQWVSHPPVALGVWQSLSFPNRMAEFCP